MRLGIHTGLVVAGIVGVKKFGTTANLVESKKLIIGGKIDLPCRQAGFSRQNSA